MSEELVRATTAAKTLGVVLGTISSLKRKGKLFGPHGYVSRQSLAALLAERESKPDDEVTPVIKQKRPKSGGFFRPKRYKKGERDSMGSVNSGAGSNTRKNHHYIVMKP